MNTPPVLSFIYVDDTVVYVYERKSIREIILMNKVNKEDGTKSNIGLIAVIGILIAIIVVALIGAKFIKHDEPETLAKQADATQEKWQEGVISYDGKYYKYNTNIKSYLFMGIDRTGTVEENAVGGNAGQADVLFLLVQDKKHDTLSAIAINRNTMTDIGIYDINNQFVRNSNEQICLAHTYGDGKRISADYTVDAVEKLLFDIPISGYLAMNMDGISVLNDALGGVEVEVMDTLKDSSKGVSLTQGETKTLSGKEAYVYIRSRDVDEFNSATRRLERQKQYVEAMINKVKTTSMSASDASKIYDEISDYTVTNMTIADFILEIKDYTYSGEMYNLPGEMTDGENFEEYNVDSEELYKMIIDIFYDEVEPPVESQGM